MFGKNCLAGLAHAHLVQRGGLESSQLPLGLRRLCTSLRGDTISLKRDLGTCPAVRHIDRAGDTLNSRRGNDGEFTKLGITEPMLTHTVWAICAIPTGLARPAIDS